MRRTRIARRPPRFPTQGRRKTTPPRRRPISPASPEQRAKVKGAVSIVSGEGPCDPAHLVDRSLGGCDDPLCVVPLVRSEHRAFEAGELDLLPALIAHGLTAEVQHALGHLEGNVIGLLEKLTGERWQPAKTSGVGWPE